jgi:hypothetical protein
MCKICVTVIIVLQMSRACLHTVAVAGKDTTCSHHHMNPRYDEAHSVVFSGAICMVLLTELQGAQNEADCSVTAVSNQNS